MLCFFWADTFSEAGGQNNFDRVDCHETRLEMEKKNNIISGKTDTNVT